jgi:hypothetical protein
VIVATLETSATSEDEVLLAATAPAEADSTVHARRPSP